MNSQGIEIEEPRVSDLKQALLTAERKEREYQNTLSVFRAQMNFLELERGGLLTGSESGLAIADDVARLQVEIDTFSAALKTVRAIKTTTEARLRRVETLAVLDTKSAQLVAVSTQIGAHQIAGARLFQDAARIAQEINQIAEDVMPQGSQFRARWGNGANDVFQPSSAENIESQITILEEAAAALGDFVNGRLASLRTLVDMALTAEGKNKRSEALEQPKSTAFSVLGGHCAPPAELDEPFGG